MVTSILISGHSADICEGIRGLLAGAPDLEVGVHLRVSADPLHGVAVPPDLLVIVLGPDRDEALATLELCDGTRQPPTIIVGPDHGATLLRRAMQAGIRDYLIPPIAPGELIAAIARLRQEPARTPGDTPRGFLVAVINVKGGSGASFLSASLAHLIAVQRQLDVGLLDLDLQFGALPLSFDLEQRTTLLEALAAASQLDGTALRGYMARHDSRVHLLSAMSEQLVLPWEVSEGALLRLLEVLRGTFPVSVVDLPRQIDPLTTTVLNQADRVLMVMQQSLAHVRDAKRMQRVLTTTLGVPRDRLTLVLNRHSDKHSVRGRDVQETVSPPSMAILPNDYRTVTEALNVGVPIHEYNRDAPIARAIADLVGHLGLAAVPDLPARKRGLREAFASALRS